MIRFLVRTALTGLAFMYLLPMIPGIDFHGNFGIAVVAALILGIVGWLVDMLAVVLAAVWTISTLGLALLILIPLWVLGFWLLPAVTLHVVADMMPTHLTVNGWLPAIEGGLVLLVVGVATSPLAKKKQDD